MTRGFCYRKTGNSPLRPPQSWKHGNSPHPSTMIGVNSVGLFATGTRLVRGDCTEQAVRRPKDGGRSDGGRSSSSACRWPALRSAFISPITIRRTRVCPRPPGESPLPAGALPVRVLVAEISARRRGGGFHRMRALKHRDRHKESDRRRGGGFHRMRALRHGDRRNESNRSPVLPSPRATREPRLTLD